MSTDQTSEPWNSPRDNPTVDLLNLVQGINTSLHNIDSSVAQLVSIEQQRLTLETKFMTPAIIQALITALTALTALVKAQAGDAAALATAQSSLAALQATDAALQDPALTTAANDAIAAANAATAPAVIPPVTPALFDPTVTYAAGATVTDSTGNVWTAVTPVLGEAPGVTAGNWTETTPAATTS
jgi:hypothetical protein